MTSGYERAGLTSAEIDHLASLISSAESSDPSVPWIAVVRADVMSVVAVLDRLVEDGAADPPSTGSGALGTADHWSPPGRGDATS
jgi:hypothetical protein